MNNFAQMLQAWQSFYATVASSSATLAGLLFVSLSIDRDRFDDNAIRTARRTFGNLINVLVLALIFLIPQDTPLGLCVALFVFGLALTIGHLRDAIGVLRGRNQRSSIQSVLREIGLPLLSAVGTVAVAIAIYSGITSAMFWPVGVLVTLLVTASWNAWLLLLKP